MKHLCEEAFKLVNNSFKSIQSSYGGDGEDGALNGDDAGGDGDAAWPPWYEDVERRQGGATGAASGSGGAGGRNGGRGGAPEPRQQQQPAADWSKVRAAKGNWGPKQQRKPADFTRKGGIGTAGAPPSTTHVPPTFKEKENDDTFSEFRRTPLPPFGGMQWENAGPVDENQVRAAR